MYSIPPFSCQKLINRFCLFLCNCSCCLITLNPALPPFSIFFAVDRTCRKRTGACLNRLFLHNLITIPSSSGDALKNLKSFKHSLRNLAKGTTGQGVWYSIQIWQVLLKLPCNPALIAKNALNLIQNDSLTHVLTRFRGILCTMNTFGYIPVKQYVEDVGGVFRQCGWRKYISSWD